MEYFEKLKDPRWQKLRLKVFERDDWECRWCSNKDITLVVHHLYYERNKNPWDYPDEAFLTLCQPCHQFNHEQRHVAETALINALQRTGFSPAGVMSMAERFQNADYSKAPPLIMSGLIEELLTNKDVQKKVYPVLVKHLQESISGNL